MIGQRIGDGDDPGRPFVDLMDSGMLWLINTTVFHPRGLALALHVDTDGKADGWSLKTAGPGEAYRYATPCDVDDPAKVVDIDEAFRRAEFVMTLARDGKFDAWEPQHG